MIPNKCVLVHWIVILFLFFATILDYMDLMCYIILWVITICYTILWGKSEVECAELRKKLKNSEKDY